MKNVVHKIVLASLPLCYLLSTYPQPAIAQGTQKPLGIFEGHSDVGTVLPAGTATYDAVKQTYTVSASGENMWMQKDAFHFVWKKVSGDVSLAADVRFPEPGHNPHRKAVILVRQNLDDDAVYADAALHGSGLTALQYRTEKGDYTQDVELNFSTMAEAPSRFSIEKRGDHVAMLVSMKGEPLHPVGTATRIHLNGPFYIGLGICSHDKDVTEKAVFSNVELHELTSAASKKPTLYSTLQIISLDRHARRSVVAYTAPIHFEAPNWTRDGKSLIFDQGGHIMTIPADAGAPQSPKAIETGKATGCNGSHGLSPDGKSLAISCNTPDAPGSRVYIVPSTGGDPRIVTENPSSYFHSWSPDGKTIAFTRPHPGGGDIWSISIEGGKETRITTSTGISDDPDYSPDGQYIYFNSDRGGGAMQIWRMHADGSNPEQITSDEMNNWTPHISPDGKWMVFLSYQKGVTGHQANKDISLRLMSLSDRKISTLVDLLGGGGTINVPSWSPDSKSLAYVSYELADSEAK